MQHICLCTIFKFISYIYKVLVYNHGRLKISNKTTQNTNTNSSSSRIDTNTCDHAILAIPLRSRSISQPSLHTLPLFIFISFFFPSTVLKGKIPEEVQLQVINQNQVRGQEQFKTHQTQTSTTQDSHQDLQERSARARGCTPTLKTVPKQFQSLYFLNNPQ